jgi:hypothetical protein
MRQDKPVWFPQWMERLKASGLGAGQVAGTASVIRWYLSFCKRGRVGVTFESARDFIRMAQEEKQPSGALLEGCSDYQRARVRQRLPTVLRR